MPRLCKVTVNNIDKLYSNYYGNLYYKSKGAPADAYEPASEFDVEELKAAIAHDDIDVIFVAFSALISIANACAM